MKQREDHYWNRCRWHLILPLDDRREIADSFFNLFKLQY